LRRLSWRRLASGVALLTVAVLGGIWAWGQPGNLMQVDESPQPRTATPQGPSDGPTPSVVTPSGSGASNSPTPAEPTSLDPTAFPTIPECIAPRRFSVLTFNIHGGRTDHGLDLDAVVAEIRGARADVVLLQEVDRNLARTGFLNQPAMLAEALGMSVYYRANVRSNAILTRFPVMEWSSTALPRWPGKEERRLVHASVLVEGQAVHVFNTHLDHTSVALRLAQIRAVQSVVSRYADAPMVLGGDLNAIPGGPVLTTLRSDLRDAWPAAGEGSGNTVPAHDPRRRIDYLLHNSWLSMHAGEVLPTRASDHAALRIVFDLWGTQACAH
jgi:endonuclease/exonuclease/phosphatase family metal-dependent hydrolase